MNLRINRKLLKRNEYTQMRSDVQGGGLILYPWPSISNQSSSSANRPDLYKSDLCWTFDHTVTRWFQCNEIRTIQHSRVWPLEPHMPTCAWPTCTRHRDEHVCLKCVWVWMWVWVCHYLCKFINNTFYSIRKKKSYSKILWLHIAVQTHINHDRFYIHSFSFF